jgi:hypothetical protein
LSLTQKSGKKGRFAKVSVRSQIKLMIFPDKFDFVITHTTMPTMTGVHLTKKLSKIRSDILITICACFSEKISEEKQRPYKNVVFKKAKSKV